MPPMDPSPLGDEMVRRLPERKFPQPKPGENVSGPAAGSAGSTPDIAHRPALPDHPHLTAADIEDEDADPVIDTGPGIDERPGPTATANRRG